MASNVVESFVVYYTISFRLDLFDHHIGCLHHRANTELAQTGLLEPCPLAQM